MDPSSPQQPKPTPEQLDTRAKNIEAVKQLLTPEEWADVREAAYAEKYAETATTFAKTLEELNRLKSSVGKLYGHFQNVMHKWSIPSLTSYGKEQDRPVPESVVKFPPPEPQPLVKPKGKAVFRFDPDNQNLVPVPEAPVPPSPPEKKESAAPTPKKKRAPSRFPRTPAPAKETAWRRELMEKQIKLRPSRVDEILSRLTAEGFPVSKPYYAEIVEGRRSRIRTLVLADIYLLIRHRVLHREAPGRYAWVKGVPANYKSFSNKK